MRGVIDPIDVRVTGDDEWKLLADFDWYGITVPEGFVTNFGSIPPPIRPFINPVGKLRPGFLIHDWLYHRHGKLKEPIMRKGITRTLLSRRECDLELFNIGKIIGYNSFKNQMVYRALRIGGWYSWDKYF